MHSASERSIDLLIETNALLVQKLADHEEVTRNHVTCRKDLELMRTQLTSTAQECDDARAEKAALEQEMRLGNAQKAMKRKGFLMLTVPCTIGTAMFTISVAVLYPMCFAFREQMGSYIATSGLPVFAGCLLVLFSVRPNHALSIRTLSLLPLLPDAFVPNAICAWLAVFSLLDGLRPTCKPISYAMAFMAIMLGVCNTFFWCTLLRVRGRAAELSFRERVNLTMQFMQTTFGRKCGCLLLASSGIMYTVWQAAALARACPPHVSDRIALNRLWIYLRTSFVLTSLTFICTCFYFLATATDDTEWLPPWLNATELTQREISMEADASRQAAVSSCHLFVALLIFAGPIMSTPVRGRLYTWLSAVDASTAASSASEIAALLGKQEPRQVLAAARRQFFGLPFGKMSQADLVPTIHRQSNLNHVTKRCRLGEVDAFISRAYALARPEPTPPARFSIRWRPEDRLFAFACCADSWHDAAAEK